MAPGASLVGLKVFGNAPTAPTSRFIQAIDYAVNTAGVDVINESFGGNPFPDNGNDPITLADNAAVDAGVTVVASTGDAGTNNTIGSPASGAKIIGVAATTSFRSYQQETGFAALSCRTAPGSATTSPRCPARAASPRAGGFRTWPRRVTSAGRCARPTRSLRGVHQQRRRTRRRSRTSVAPASRRRWSRARPRW